MNMTSWISSQKQNPQARLRLFCFPYSGAAASIYYPWSAVLPNIIEVCPIQYPGHGTRVGEPLISNLPDLAQQTYQALKPYLDKPFAFFGHSMGALASFELARYLFNTDNPTPVYLFVSGHNAPQFPDKADQIHNLPEQEFVDRLRKFNGTPEDVLQNEELRELILPILRTDFMISETYDYQPMLPLGCPICACGGLQDDYTTREGLAAWQEQTSAACSVRMFPGDHFYLNESRMMLLQVIARELIRYT
jgi:medium-chain acyl-[acyl-carrier-protein] hydrolase